jgi:hypothetical protein
MKSIYYHVHLAYFSSYLFKQGKILFYFILFQTYQTKQNLK